MGLALLAALPLAIVGGLTAAPPSATIATRLTIFQAGYANYSQFRIPALLVIPKAAATSTTPLAGDIVLAFAEARGPNRTVMQPRPPLLPLSKSQGHL